jgi:hypothetical protein
VGVTASRKPTHLGYQESWVATFPMMNFVFEYNKALASELVCLLTKRRATLDVWVTCRMSESSSDGSRGVGVQRILLEGRSRTIL